MPATHETHKGGAAHLLYDGRLLFWTLLLTGGFVYVAGVLCCRDMPLHSRQGDYAELIKLLVSAPVLFYLGVRHTLEPFNQGWRLILFRNIFCFALPFFIALHWYYLQAIPQVNYSLTVNDLSRIPSVGRIVFLSAGALMLGLMCFHFLLAYRAKSLVPYAGTLLGLIALLVGISWALSDHYSVHIHHYFLFGLFIPFARFNHPVSMVCQALCAGVYVEGICEWGMSTLWYPH